MKTECIECHTTWGEDDKDEIKSSGLCKGCGKVLMLELIRKKQRDQGNFDCFGRSDGYCNQVGCRYRLTCL